MMRVSLVEMAKGNESVSKGWAKRLPIKFEKLGLGKVNPGQNLFGATRLSDGSHFGRADQGKRIPYVCWCQVAERTNANKIGENRLRESEPRSKFVWVHKAEWWESVWSSRPREMNPICMLVSRGWAKQTPIKFEKPDWGKVNRGQILFGSRSSREKRHTFLLVACAWVKRILS